jgi:hypothetical protein
MGRRAVITLTPCDHIGERPGLSLQLPVAGGRLTRTCTTESDPNALAPAVGTTDDAEGRLAWHLCGLKGVRCELSLQLF